MTRKAFTLVEVMVTLAIVSILMSVSLGLTTKLSAEHQENLADYKAEGETGRLEHLLRLDAQGCRACRKVENGIEFKTKCWLDPVTLKPRMIPATVRYEIISVEEQHWLVRSQWIGTGKSIRELFCQGVNDISFSSPKMRFGDQHLNLKSGDSLNISVGLMTLQQSKTYKMQID